MSNTAIRKRAWGLFRAHYPRVCAVMLLTYVLQSAPDIVGLIPAVVVPSWVATVFKWLVAPVTSVGLTWYLFGLWAGQSPDARRVGAFLAPMGVLLRALALNAVANGMLYLLTLPLTKVPLGMLGSRGAIFIVLGLLVLMVATLWVIVRIEPATLAFARDPEHRPINALAVAWRSSRGSVRRILGMVIVTIWPVLALVIAAALLARSDMRGVVTTAATALTYALYTGYVRLALVGLYAELLDAKK